MDLKFQSRGCFFLDPVVREAENCEQTHEIKLTEGYPDVGKILTAWGQPVLRSKSWENDTLTVVGGIMVWILYVPEDGTQEHCVEGWIPFQERWDLPDDLPEGTMQVHLLPRIVEARNISPRKIQVRAGVGIMMEAFVPREAMIPEPESIPAGIEVLRQTYPLRLRKEAGEKSFGLEEDWRLPESVPAPEQIISCRMESCVTDRKVLTEKVVFRGSVALHIVYRGEEGHLHSWEQELPFSQYAELSGEYGADAQAEFTLCTTGMDLELGEEKAFHFKSNIAAQYLISDREMLSVVEDAYCPGQEMTVQTEAVEIPVILDKRKETVFVQQRQAAQGASIVEERYLPDVPKINIRTSGKELEQTGMYQSLYYGPDGTLEAESGKWDASLRLNGDENTVFSAVPGQISASGLKTELPLELTAETCQKLEAVASLLPGEERKPDPGRPSLILRRAGRQSLWEVAKSANSTVSSIREANSLQNEPVPGQLLLIPVL